MGASYPSRNRPNVAVVIPALNEEAGLPLVLGDLPPEWASEIIVVDNGSEDGTARAARRGGATVVSEPHRGYGAACLRGLAELEQRRGGPPDVVVFLDANYSDYPEKLPELVRPILEEGYDLVLGSRLSGERGPAILPPPSAKENRVACFLMWLLFGARYTDLGPFRAIRWRALRRLGMADRHFGWTVEMQIKAARQGLRTLEIPVPCRPRIGGRKIGGTIHNVLAAGSKILYLIAKYGIRPPRPSPLLLRR